LKPSNKINQLSDKDLVKEIVLSKKSILFAELYDRYASLVYNRCLSFVSSKMEAEDLTHDIFLLLYVKLKTFKGKSKFSTWLYSLTYNFCVNYIQRNTYKVNEKTQKTEITKELDMTITDYDILQLKTEKLKKVLSILNPKHKMVLLLKYQDELSLREIQTVLKISESAVKMRLKRAREKVMELYKKI
jgi:RNA polymerase sigma-70 factor (ECF subfamily)